ncbi:MAG: hypothetical protein JRC68_08330 [Deltaproteobacteria bacterium]|nr:hypothetical protein [Deltaproteobacteria bacterium]
MDFAESVADSKRFRGIKVKYLTTPMAGGTSKRYRLKETAIVSFSQLNRVRTKSCPSPLNRDLR